MKRKTKEPSINWKAMLVVEERAERISRHGTEYVVLYLSTGGTVCSPKNLGQEIEFFEPYIFEGKVKFSKGGTFLLADRAEKFNPTSFSIRDSF